MDAIAARRLAHQQLAAPSRTPADLVRWMGAVQAQDPLATRWAVGVRSPDVTDADVARAIDAGAIVRTHAMRYTWQLIAPDDVRWILALVGPKLLAGTARRDAELGLDAAQFKTSRKAIERALRDAAALTRAELAAVLAAAGVAPDGQRLSHLLGRAELEGVIGGGPRRGSQSTHVALHRLAPERTVPPRDELRAVLARRYFESRGPATVDDFTWWSGLTAGDARAGHAAIAGELARDGDLWWTPGRDVAGKGVWLLPAFDEYLVGYRTRDHVLEPACVKLLNAGGGLLAPCVVVDGRVIATWRRELGRGAVAIAITPFDPPRGERAIIAAARRYAAFLGLDAEITFTAPARSSAPPPARPRPSSARSPSGPRRAAPPRTTPAPRRRPR